MAEPESSQNEAQQPHNEEHSHELDHRGESLEHSEEQHRYGEGHRAETESAHSHHHESDDEQLTFDNVDHDHEKEHESSLHEYDEPVEELEQEPLGKGVKKSLIAHIRTPVHDALIKQFKSLHTHEDDDEQFTFDNVEQVHETDDTSLHHNGSEIPVKEPDHEGDDEFFALDRVKDVPEKENKSQLQHDPDSPVDEIEYEEQQHMDHRESESSHEQLTTSTTNELYDLYAIPVKTRRHDDVNEHANDHSSYMHSMDENDQHHHCDSPLMIDTLRRRGTNEQVEIRTQMHSSGHSTLVRSSQRINEDIPPDTGAVKQLLQKLEKEQYKNNVRAKPKEINIFESLDDPINDEVVAIPAVPLKEGSYHRFQELRYRQSTDTSKTAVNPQQHREHREVNVGESLVDTRSEILSKQSYQPQNKTASSASAAHKASPPVHHYTPSPIHHYTAPATSPKAAATAVPVAMARTPRQSRPEQFNSIRVVRNVRDYVKAYGRKVNPASQQRAVTHIQTSRVQKAPVSVPSKRDVLIAPSRTSPTHDHHEADVPCCCCTYLMHHQRSQQHIPGMEHSSHHVIPMPQHNNDDVYRGTPQHGIDLHKHHHRGMGQHLQQYGNRAVDVDLDRPFTLVPVSKRRAAYEKKCRDDSSQHTWKA